MISTAEYQKKFGAATRSNKTKVAETQGSNAAVSPLLALDAKLLSLRYKAVFETYESLLTY